jgi:hypothetical protein
MQIAILLKKDKETNGFYIISIFPSAKTNLLIFTGEKAEITQKTFV